MSDSGSVLNASSFAEIAVVKAEKSRENGTFGVGGLLIDDNGSIVKVAGNGVIRENSVFDPTAHVECQLVDWYYSNRRAKQLAPPDKMTIITSLDPCVMCSGAILLGGFNAIHISQDDEAGVSCRGQGDFSTMPENLRPLLKSKFSAFGITGKRGFNGPNDSMFSGKEINDNLDQRSADAFGSSLKTAKEIFNTHHAKPLDEMTDPRMLADAKSGDPRIYDILKKYNPSAFSAEYHTSLRGSDSRNLGDILVKSAKKSWMDSGVFDSACLIDPFGNVLLAESCRQGSSSVTSTPFVQLMRKYHSMLFEAGPGGENYFAHPKYCSIILLMGPGEDPGSMMDVGCFGASIQGELPRTKTGPTVQYVLPRQSRRELKQMLDNLPPLYSRVVNAGDVIQQVQDNPLQEFCQKEEYAEFGEP
ncbi:MAG TPA: nucleoside deaminase [Nitrososphaera sp.]|nr:nucleoside deaminase [Nitrososphaera sp.]